MSSFQCKINLFNDKIIAKKGPLPYSGKAGHHYLKTGVVKYKFESENPHGCVALVYDTQGNLVGRAQGWHRECLFVEDVEQSFVDTLQSHDQQVEFNYL